MPRKSKYREYKLKIDAYTPETIPMARLAEYLADLAIVLGNRERVHFNRLESVFQGVPIRVGGEGDPVPVHLEHGKNKYIVLARRTLAKEIARYLFSAVVRVEGTGRWTRAADGEWELHTYCANSMQLIEDADIRKNISELRQIEADWKNLEDPLGGLQKIQHGKTQ